MGWTWMDGDGGNGSDTTQRETTLKIDDDPIAGSMWDPGVLIM